MHITDALAKFQVQLLADGRSPHTCGQYRRHVTLLARWLEAECRDPNVETIDHEVLALFLVSDAALCTPDGRPKKATTMNALRTSVRTFFSYLHGAGTVPSNPARLVRRARCASPPPRGLTDDDRSRLLKELDGARSERERRDAVLFRVMLLTGIRIGSAIALDAEDVVLEAGELTLRTMKNDCPDRIFLPTAAVELLRPLVESRGSGPLFVGWEGRRLSARHVQRRLQAWRSRAGIRRPVTPHSLRHTFATRLYERTRDLPLVQAALRHRSILSTTQYTRVAGTRLRHALQA